MSDSPRPPSGPSDNPFAPAAEPGTYRSAASGASGAARKLDLDAARKALAAHVGNSAVLEADRYARGGRVRTVPLVATALGLLLGLTAGGVVSSTSGDDAVIFAIVAGIVGFFAALLGGIFVILDLRLGDRDQPQDVDGAARAYWRSIAMRPPYAWTILSPTARALPVTVPDLTPVIVTPGTHELGSPASFKTWTEGFVRVGGGQQRQLRVVTNPVVTTLEGDYAETETQVEFSSIPRWFMVVAAVGIVLIRIIGLVLLLVAQFVLRQKRIVTVHQRWLRASNGVWYLLDADVPA